LVESLFIVLIFITIYLNVYCKDTKTERKKEAWEFNGSNFISVKVTDADAFDSTKIHAARFV
jgi:hypothetical protein